MKKILSILTFSALFSLVSFAQPANNACGGSITVLDDGSCTAGTTVAGSDLLAGEVGCATAGPASQHIEVWYDFVASGGGITYNLTSGMGTIEMVVLSSTGPCAGLGLEYSDCGAPALTGSFGGLTIGNTYYVLISAPSNATGAFSLCLTTIPAPANDLECGAIALTPNGASDCSANYGATSTGDDAASCFTTENGMWYSITVATAPSLLQVSADDPATNFDAQIAIFSSSNDLCSGTFTELACDDNSGSGSNPVATTQITSAGTYFAYIDGYGGATGDFCINAILETCSDGIQNQDESGVDCGGVCAACSGGSGYLHPTGVDVDCMVNTCAGDYYDDGGSGGNYANAVNQAYRTFCPDAAGQCVSATFSSFEVEVALGMVMGVTTSVNCWDYMIVLDGPSGGSPITWAGCDDPAYPMITLAGTYANPITSTDESGCLTFMLVTDATATSKPGWAISLSCAACAGGVPNGGPSGTDMTDCVNAYEVCANTALVGASVGPGLNSGGCAACLITENFASWYKITIASSGTMAPVMTPTAANDYDFALYQASSCAALGSPVRCSYAAGTTATGMLASETDNTEGAGGNGYVDSLHVLAGDVYYLLVNQFDAGGNGFDLDWVLSDGASLDCAPLPVKIGTFDAKANGSTVDITWTTFSELNNDFFSVERSVDGKTFSEITTVKGAGNSNETLNYMTIDGKPKHGISYYRLKQTDFNGERSYSHTVAVSFGMNGNVAVFPNPNKGAFELSFDNGVKGNYQINVFDMTGRQVYYEEFEVLSKHINKNIDFGQLPKGVYLLRLSNMVEKTFLKVVID